MKSAHENQQFSDATIEHSNYDKGSRERKIERLIFQWSDVPTICDALGFYQLLFAGWISLRWTCGSKFTVWARTTFPHRWAQ